MVVSVQLSSAAMTFSDEYEEPLISLRQKARALWKLNNDTGVSLTEVAKFPSVP